MSNKSGAAARATLAGFLEHLERRSVVLPGQTRLPVRVAKPDGEDGQNEVAELEAKGIRVDKSDMADEKFKEALVGPKTGNGIVLQLMEWKEGPMDVSPEGKERLKQKYRETPGLRLIA